MKRRAQREVLSQKVCFFQENVCAPPSSNIRSKSACRNKRTSLCALRKGSLTIETAVVLPIFLGILLTFFSCFQQYALVSDLSVQAAVKAKELGIVLGVSDPEECGDITIYEDGIWEPFQLFPFQEEKKVVQKAVCRAWVGFTGLEEEETYVYVTPNASVYHLSRDCTHLKLSIQMVSFADVDRLKNQYGEKYGQCGRCEEPKGWMVYLTSEGTHYHSDRSCSSLKRTVKQVPLTQVSNLECCLRCSERGGI